MKKRRITLLQIIVHLYGWYPLVRLIYDYFHHHLTANPIQAIEQRTGLQALVFLLLSLACTPLSSIGGWKELTQRRRALGDYAFLYAVCHLFTFFVIDYGLNLRAVWVDVHTKWYIILGALAFLMLLPLAITSFNYWMKRLGKNWKRLHKLVYIISPLVVFHFILVVKGNLARLQGNLGLPLLYGGIMILLLALRIPPLKKALIKLRTRAQTRLRALRPQVDHL